jgi:hypothetical protein
MMTKLEKYMLERVDELKSLATHGDPWFFLCASSFIEYLAKLTNGNSTTHTDYKEFLKNYFFKVNTSYKNFKYSSGKQDLDVQMYHVLRCGIIHNFSLIADPQAKKKGGRDRSILLAHKKSSINHLSNYINNSNKTPIDACIFIAEDFADDIEKATKYVFILSRKQNPTGKKLRENIKSWSKKHPPISGKFCSKR